MKVLLFFTFIMFGYVQIVTGETLTKDQQEVKQFIVKLYSHGVENFEMGKFNGKYQPKKQCDLYEQFLISSLIKVNKRGDLIQCTVEFSLYPSMDSEDLVGPYPTNPLSHFKIVKLMANGDKASVTVIADVSKLIFFLTKAENGWRIENAITFNEWPKKRWERNECDGGLISEKTATLEQKQIAAAEVTCSDDFAVPKVRKSKK